MPLIFLPSEKAGRGRGPGTGEGGFLPRSLASPSPGVEHIAFNNKAARRLIANSVCKGYQLVISGPSDNSSTKSARANDARALLFSF